MLNAYKHAEMLEALLELFQSMHQVGRVNPHRSFVQAMFGGINDLAIHIALNDAFGKIVNVGES